MSQPLIRCWEEEEEEEKEKEEEEEEDLITTGERFYGLRRLMRLLASRWQVGVPCAQVLITLTFLRLSPGSQVSITVEAGRTFKKIQLSSIAAVRAASL